MMQWLRFGFVTGPILGITWMFIIVLTVAVAMSFATGHIFAPDLSWSIIWGAAAGFGIILRRDHRILAGLVLSVFALSILPYGPLNIGSDVEMIAVYIAALLLTFCFVLPLHLMLRGVNFGALNRHEFETAVIRFIAGFGYIFFTAIVLIPFYIMVMTSLKSQSDLLLNPLDFSLDLSKGWGLFRSYHELFAHFNFGKYLSTLSAPNLDISVNLPGSFSGLRILQRFINS
mgnify:CR=1 FL=1